MNIEIHHRPSYALAAVDLEPGETVVAESGAMISMDSHIRIETSAGMSQGLMKGLWCLDPSEGLSPGQKVEIDRVTREHADLSDDVFVAVSRRRARGREAEGVGDGGGGRASPRGARGRGGQGARGARAGGGVRARR